MLRGRQRSPPDARPVRQRDHLLARTGPLRPDDVLTDRYLDGIPAGSRATHSPFLQAAAVEANLPRVRRLNEIVARRGQTLAQMALAWALRDPRVTSAVVGASSVAQLEANLGALDGPAFGAEELAEIEVRLAQ
jgi:L-glyceraldehyde 3-phosphate reductase